MMVVRVTLYLPCRYFAAVWYFAAAERLLGLNIHEQCGSASSGSVYTAAMAENNSNNDGIRCTTRVRWLHVHRAYSLSSSSTRIEICLSAVNALPLGPAAADDRTQSSMAFWTLLGSLDCYWAFFRVRFGQNQSKSRMLLLRPAQFRSKNVNKLIRWLLSILYSRFCWLLSSCGPITWGHFENNNNNNYSSDNNDNNDCMASEMAMPRRFSLTISICLSAGLLSVLLFICICMCTISLCCY